MESNIGNNLNSLLGLNNDQVCTQIISPPNLPVVDQGMELAKMMAAYTTPEEIRPVLLAAAKIYSSWGNPVYICKT